MAFLKGHKLVTAPRKALGTDLHKSDVPGTDICPVKARAKSSYIWALSIPRSLQAAFCTPCRLLLPFHILLSMRALQVPNVQFKDYLMNSLLPEKEIAVRLVRL